MTWVWDAANNCWRGVSDATIAAWRAWRIGHRHGWHPTPAWVGSTSIRCVKAGVLWLPMAIPGATLPYAIAPPSAVNVVPPVGELHDTYLGPSGYPSPLSSAYGPGPIAIGFIPPFGVPPNIVVQPVPGVPEQPVVLPGTMPPGAVPPTDRVSSVPPQPASIPEPGTIGIFGVALLSAILVRLRRKHDDANA